MDSIDQLLELAKATRATMSMVDQGAATYVSTPGGGPVANTPPGAPGAAGPGAQMGMGAAIAWLIIGAGATTVAVGYLARKGVKPQIGRFDVVQVIFSAAGTAVVFGTAKTLAYRWHGHKVAQAVLLLL